MDCVIVNLHEECLPSRFILDSSFVRRFERLGDLLLNRKGGTVLARLPLAAILALASMGCGNSASKPTAPTSVPPTTTAALWVVN